MGCAKIAYDRCSLPGYRRSKANHKLGGDGEGGP